jgi:hypothetical protein
MTLSATATVTHRAFGIDNFKKISSWAAILFAPTLVGTIYGMNFDRMPELHWVLGYPFAIVLSPTAAPPRLRDTP